MNIFKVKESEHTLQINNTNCKEKAPYKEVMKNEQQK